MQCDDSREAVNVQNNRRGTRLAEIAADIERHGVSVTLVSGGPLPRFAYTIGLRESVGFDLVMAGASYYTAREVHAVLNDVAAGLRAGSTARALPLPALGQVSLSPADASWSSALGLGASDFYGVSNPAVAQVVPDGQHWTIDVPDMTHEWKPGREPIWRWLRQSWEYGLSPSSVATTNLAALRGGPITELARWEDDQWEMFCRPGPDVTPDDVRVIPLATLLAFDESLLVAVDLPLGEGRWREGLTSEWQDWKRSE
jgi:hypothetical protein